MVFSRKGIRICSNSCVLKTVLFSKTNWVTVRVPATGGDSGELGDSGKDSGASGIGEGEISGKGCG